MGESIFKKLCKWGQSSVKGPWKCPSNRTLVSKRVSVPFEDRSGGIQREGKFYCGDRCVQEGLVKDVQS